jgi:hypothetical protein
MSEGSELEIFHPRVSNRLIKPMPPRDLGDGLPALAA